MCRSDVEQRRQIASRLADAKIGLGEVTKDSTKLANLALLT